MIGTGGSRGSRELSQSALRVLCVLLFKILQYEIEEFGKMMR
jgi:hypothetical protein